MGEKGATSSKPETLHPEYTVTNIENKVHVLDVTKVSNSSWVKLFQLHELGYDVLNHIDGTKAPAEDSDEYAAWRKVDAIVLQWIYGSLSDELLIRVLESKSTTFEAWTGIKNLFHNKKVLVPLVLTTSSPTSPYEPFRPSKPTVNVSKNSLISSMMSVAPLMKIDSFFSLFAVFPLNLMLLFSKSATSPLGMLQLEQQHQSARDSNSVATPVAATVTQDPPSRRDQRRDHPQSRVPSQRRDQHPSNRPPPSQPTRAQNYPMVRPNVWQTQPPAGYWTPWWASTPPCPFPTQPGWADPTWPSSARAPSRSQDAALKPTTPQAHLSEVSPLEPTDLGTALHAMTLDPGDSQWYVDTGATNHLTSDPGYIQVLCVNYIKSICVGNGGQASVSGSGHTTIPTHPKPIRLNNVLYVSNIIKNLISVRKFTTDNSLVSFDLFGFDLKDLKTGKHLSRHNSTGPLYSFNSLTNALATILIATSIFDVWHDRLGHPRTHVFDYLVSRNSISCNKLKNNFVCNACQLAKHKRLPFDTSFSTTLHPFDLIHCDLWTSPIVSKNGSKYYMVLIDNYSQFTWAYPLKYKSETFTMFTGFHTYIQTQFNKSIKTLQCDMGGDFDNTSFKTFAHSHGFQFRFSCPQTSQQNEKSERMIRRLNEIMLTLLTCASLPPIFWEDALHTSVYLHNILPTKLHNFQTPTSLFYHKHPSYSYLRTFGCACFPNHYATRTHKLAPRSSLSNFHGYRCLELSTGKIFISRHVIFDKTSFPYSFNKSSPSITHRFLDPDSPSLLYTHPPYLDHTLPHLHTLHSPLLRPVVKPTTTCTVLSLATSRSWPIHQLDVKNAFLHGELRETVYMFQPSSFMDRTNPNYVCRLKKSLHLALVSQVCHLPCDVWFTSNTSLFVYKWGNDMAYLLLYVDHIILTASNTKLLQGFITKLSKEFAMSDLRALHHFLGIEVTKRNGGLFFSQATYVANILSRANMTDCKPCATPADIGSKLSATYGEPLADGTLYRSLIGGLQYLTFTRPDIAYAV
ncbi:LOW QUALITY PROTEIN: hypothetical protein OSB04_011001 [Centaurea solstitialis]|uniref:Integrase catalytic domain-containing protein n=1 Tax=Centaurea solstitialis TaxID=347529 RepID=A0AA38WCH7_9ASTR|nr:LOW QUALITY PROTEIN: hypothetical protein OSB04_011001 [Centaurea solstitialis]